MIDSADRYESVNLITHNKLQSDMSLQINSGSDETTAVFEIIDDELARVRQLICRQITGDSSKLGTAKLLVERFGGRAGKMFRAGLVLLAGTACGEISENHIRIAAVIEMMHSASLLHDDVLDHGRKRRRLPTVNVLCGNESAVLLGDLLLGGLFKMASQLKPQFVKIIASTAVKICRGELKQIEQRWNWQLEEDEYIDIIKQKTAVLFADSCLLGALAAGAEKGKARALAEFGLNTGIAFQIADDLLDIAGQECRIEKTLGNDIKEGRPTLPVIHFLRQFPGEQRNMAAEKLKAASGNREKLIKILRDSKSMQYAQDRIDRFVEKAAGQLKNIEQGRPKQALMGTLDFVRRRAGQVELPAK